jgi:Tol biopolymer transport system component
MVTIPLPDGVTAPTGYPVDWSPDSKHLVSFKSGYEWKSSLRVINAYGGPWVELGKACTLVAWGQVWTPDGTRIITESDAGFWWILPTKGDPPVKLALKPEPDPTRFVLPSFSLDLTKAAYASKEGDLWVLPLSIEETKAVGKPVKAGEKVETGLPIRVCWSPDSKWIAFPSTKEGSKDLWLASVKGGAARRLTQQPGDEPEPQGGLSWSPDSKWIAYSNKEGIWRVSSSGGEPRVLVPSEHASEPVWSPDGEGIAFIEPSHISMVHVETGEIEPLLDLKAHHLDGENAGHLVWSPDGKKLGFIGFKDPRYRVWVLSVPEGNLMELAEDDPGDKYALAWSPDGKKVSYSSDRYVRVRTGALWAMDVEELVSKLE